jgi:hypothetical protein
MALAHETSIPVIYLEPGAQDKIVRAASPSDLKAFAHGWFAADRVVFLTEHEKAVAAKVGRKYVSGSELRDFLSRRAIVSPVGVPVDLADQFCDVPKNKTPTLFWGGRANRVKRLDKVFGLYDRVYRSGRSPRVVFTSPSGKSKMVRSLGKQLESGLPIEYHPNCSREQYMELAARSHVFVAWSEREGFPVGFWEQMYLGVVGLFPKKPWAVSQLPADYPFIFSNPDDAYVQLTWVLDHYEEAKDCLQEIRRLCREVYRKELVWPRFRAIGADILEDIKLSPDFTDVAHVALSVLKADPAFRFSDFMACFEEALDQTGTKERFMRVWRHPGNYALYRFLVRRGYCASLIGDGTDMTFSEGNTND